MPKILMFAGSTRRESLNKKLIIATAEIAKKQGAEVTVIDLSDYPLPIYDGDFEEEHGQPENAKKLHQLIDLHDALVIASPEYNGLPSPLLKNAIDWVSRVDVKVYRGKIAAIMSASPGGLGGLRGLSHLRVLLNNLNVLVIPEQVAVGNALSAFAENGKLKELKQQSRLSNTVHSLLSINTIKGVGH